MSGTRCGPAAYVRAAVDGNTLTLVIMSALPSDMLYWTNQDPRQSELFNTKGIVYRFEVKKISTTSSLRTQHSTSFDLHIFQTTAEPGGKSITTLWRLTRTSREDRVARLEWARNGGLGRVVIGKVCGRQNFSQANLQASDEASHNSVLPL